MKPILLPKYKLLLLLPPPFRETAHRLCLSPLWMAGISSPSASSRITVPETGEDLSSSNGSLREAFLRPADPFCRIFFPELAPDSSPEVRGLLWSRLRFNAGGWGLDLKDLKIFCILPTQQFKRYRVWQRILFHNLYIILCLPFTVPNDKIPLNDTKNGLTRLSRCSCLIGRYLNVIEACHHSRVLFHSKCGYLE